MQNTLEKSFQRKRSEKESLISIKPGAYMMLHTNKMKRVIKESKGLLVGKRIQDDNHKVVLIDEDLILVPFENESR